MLLAASLSLLPAPAGTGVRRPRAATIVASGAASSSPLTWEELRETLDQVPIFALLDASRVPVSSRFYVDPREAERALAATTGAVSVQPVGLGAAFEVVRDAAEAEAASLVAAEADLAAARGMEGASQVGEGELPLFGCYQMRMPSKTGGGPVTPLFLGLADARAALDAATRGGAGELSLVTVSLQHMTDLMLTEGQLREPRSMIFVPTRKAVEFCNQIGAKRRVETVVREAQRPDDGGGIFPTGGWGV